MGRFFGFLPSSHYNNPKKVSLCESYPVGGTGLGQTALLYKYFEKMVGGPTVPRNQGEGSDCVGHSTARAIDILQGVQISGMGLPYVWTALASASSIYGGSRVEVARDRYGVRMEGKGSYVRYAAEFVRDFGCLYMKEYKGVDLSHHTWQLSQQWGKTGVPDDLEPESRLHGIRSYAPVKTWPEVRDAIANGWPVVVGSSFGFTKQKERDTEGFLEPRGTWQHAMVFTGVDDTTRPGALCENSWGSDWVGGPKRHGQPDGSFWVDADVVEDMARRGEAIALSGHSGFVRSDTRYNLL
jgi:hypothetical protein